MNEIIASSTASTAECVNMKILFVVQRIKESGKGHVGKD